MGARHGLQKEVYCEKFAVANEQGYRRFEQWWLKKEMLEQRICWIYGQFQQRGDRVYTVAEVFYEPRQQGGTFSSSLVRGREDDLADAVASRLGMRRYERTIVGTGICRCFLLRSGWPGGCASSSHSCRCCYCSMLVLTVV